MLFLPWQVKGCVWNSLFPALSHLLHSKLHILDINPKWDLITSLLKKQLIISSYVSLLCHTALCKPPTYLQLFKDPHVRIMRKWLYVIVYSCIDTHTVPLPHRQRQGNRFFPLWSVITISFVCGGFDKRDNSSCPQTHLTPPLSYYTGADYETIKI